MIDYQYLVVSDGGSRCHGAANDGYGSYKLEASDGRRQIVRLDLGTATNNEAEYRTLIAALEDLAGRIERADKSPSDYSVIAQTDSQLVVEQVNCRWACKSDNLRGLLYEAHVYQAKFGRCDVVKVPRAEIVRVLGH